MLPVQTVMIRYMVLVYRWGRGWSDAVGDWDGFAGGAVTGGCARRRVLAEVHLVRARKGPADEGPAGPYKYLGKSLFYLLAYSFDSASRIFNMLCRITEASIILLCLIP